MTTKPTGRQIAAAARHHLLLTLAVGAATLNLSIAEAGSYGADDCIPVIVRDARSEALAVMEAEGWTLSDLLNTLESVTDDEADALFMEADSIVSAHPMHPGPEPEDCDDGEDWPEPPGPQEPVSVYFSTVIGMLVGLDDLREA